MAGEWYESSKYHIERSMERAVSGIIDYLYKALAKCPKDLLDMCVEYMEWSLLDLVTEDYGLAKEEKNHQVVSIWNNCGYCYPSTIYDLALSQMLLTENPIDEERYLETLRRFGNVAEEFMDIVTGGDEERIRSFIEKIKGYAED